MEVFHSVNQDEILKLSHHHFKTFNELFNLQNSDKLLQILPTQKQLYLSGGKYITPYIEYFCQIELSND